MPCDIFLYFFLRPKSAVNKRHIRYLQSQNRQNLRRLKSLKRDLTRYEASRRYYLCCIKPTTHKIFTPMKTTSIEIPASILSALAANPGDTRLAASVCSAIVEAAGILGGTPVISDTGAEADPSVITQLALKKRERRKAAAEKRARNRERRERNLTRFLNNGIRNAFLSELNAMGFITKNEYRIIDAMTTDKLLKARQVENIIKPLIQRRERELAKKQGLSTGNRPHPISSMP